MTLSVKLNRTISAASRCFAPLFMAAMSAIASHAHAHAHAEWTIARADTPVTTIHAGKVYRLGSGQRLSAGDTVDHSSGDSTQFQDNSGNILLLGQDTRVRLTRDAQVVLLHGWLKVLHACNATTCPTLVVDTRRTRITPANRTVVVIAATVHGYDGADAMFCESGSAQMVALGKPHGDAAHVHVDARQFALRTRADQTIAVAAGLPPAFVAAMPVTFRDALHPLPSLQDAAASPSSADSPIGVRP